MVSTCWRLREMVKFKVAPKLNLSKLDSWNIFVENLDKLSVAEVFNRTPNIGDILAPNGCSIRLPTALVPSYPHSRAQDCYRMFDIKKYIFRNFVCFIFDPKIIPASVKLELSEYSLSPHSPGIIYRIFLNQNIFKNSSQFAAVAHSRSTVKHYDSVFSYVMYKEARVSYVNLGVSFQAITLQRLRHPYDTNCIMCPPYHSCADYDQERIRNLTIDRLGRVPTFTPLYERSLAQPLLTAKHLLNTTFLRQFNKAYYHFYRRYMACRAVYHVTKVTATVSVRGVSVTVLWPDDPLVTVDHVAIYDPIDFLTYVCSSLQIWFGISAFRSLLCQKELASRMQLANDGAIRKELSLGHN